MNMYKKIFFGIDPGATGALCVMKPDESLIMVYDLPTVKEGTSSIINGQMLSYLIDKYLRNDNGTKMDPKQALCFLEKVNSAPIQARKNGDSERRQGSKSMFNFGRNYGKIQGVLECLLVPYLDVSPNAWKKRAGLTGKDKEASRALAIKLYPSFAQDLARKKDCDRAEAILIARYGINNLL